MFVAILVILCAFFWIGMVCVYFRGEIGDWFDNRYGPETKKPRPPKKQFWRLYD